MSFDPWSWTARSANLVLYDSATYKSTTVRQNEETQVALNEIAVRDTTLEDIIRLSGIKEDKDSNTVDSYGTEQSRNATDLAQYQREHNILPGTDRWFRLWFALPKLTGERPHD